MMWRPAVPFLCFVICLSTLFFGVDGNEAPVVNAGEDQYVENPIDMVLLQGTAYDSDGVIIATSWAADSVPTGATLQTDNNNLYIYNPSPGTYQFTFYATDNEGAMSSDSVTVYVRAKGVYPSADAGDHVQVRQPQPSLVIYGNGYDEDGWIAAYKWTQTNGSAVDIGGTDTAELELYNPDIGEYDFMLTVTDNYGATGNDTVHVTILVGNSLPTVFVPANVSVSLPALEADIMVSSQDLDGTVAGYVWTQVNGDALPVVGTTSSVLQICEPWSGEYQFSVAVLDNEGGVGEAANVTVSILEAPIKSKATAAATSVALAIGVLGLFLELLGGASAVNVICLFWPAQMAAFLGYMEVPLPDKLLSMAFDFDWAVLALRSPWSFPLSGKSRAQGTGCFATPIAWMWFESTIFYGLLVMLGVVLVQVLCTALDRISPTPKLAPFKEVLSRFQLAVFIFLFPAISINSANMIKPESPPGLVVLGVFIQLFTLFIVPIAIFFSLRKRFASGGEAEWGPGSAVSDGKASELAVDDAPLIAGRKSDGSVSSPASGTWRGLAVSSFGMLFALFKPGTARATFVVFQFARISWSAFFIGVLSSSGRFQALEAMLVLLVLLTTFHFGHTLALRPYLRTADTVLYVTILFVEIVIYILLLAILENVALISGDRNGVLGTIMQSAIMFLILLSSFLALFRGVRQAKRQFRYPTVTHSKPWKRFYTSELDMCVFRQSLHLPFAKRSFNVYVYDSDEFFAEETALSPTLSFKKRFANSKGILRRGYALDIFRGSGDIFFLFDSTRFPTVQGQDKVIASKWTFQRLRKIFNAENLHFLDASLTGAREGAKELPRYAESDYFKLVGLNPDGRAGLWRGRPCELACTDFLENMSATLFASARIAASMDRAVRGAKTASPNFLRVYDYFSPIVPLLSSGASIGSSLSASDRYSRIRDRSGKVPVTVAAVVEPTDLDLQTFLRFLTFADAPHMLEELVQGILVQVIVTVHAAQTCAFGGQNLEFRHNDLVPSNLMVCLSGPMKEKFFSRKLTDPPPLPAGMKETRRARKALERLQYNTEVFDTKQYLVYVLDDKHEDGDSHTTTLFVDLHCVPLVKFVNLSSASARVLDALGKPYPAIVKAHSCPPGPQADASYDLRKFAFVFYHLLSSAQRSLGKVSDPLKNLLQEMVGPEIDLNIIPEDVVEQAKMPELRRKPHLAARRFLDHLFLKPVLQAPNARARPRAPPCFGNSTFFVEHPEDACLPSARITV